MRGHAGFAWDPIVSSGRDPCLSSVRVEPRGRSPSPAPCSASHLWGRTGAACREVQLVCKLLRGTSQAAFEVPYGTGSQSNA